MKRSIVCIAAVFTFVLPISVFATPKIGEKAPAVKIAQWFATPPASLSGDAKAQWKPPAPPVLPGATGADKHVFIVEFWATWCGPCRKSIPHLAKLHEKHKKDGLIIIGVSNEEPEVIGDFIDKKKADMPYYVGADNDMETSNVWADEVRGIPHAFVVDRGNNVVWAGNPLDEASLDETIEKVLAGKFDVEAAKKAVAGDEEFKKLMAELQPAYMAKDEKKMFELLDKLIAAKPQELQPYMIKRQMLREFKRPDEIPAIEATIEKSFKDSQPKLHDLVSIQLNEPLESRNPGMMLRCAQRANELSEGKDAECLANLAQVECQLSMVDAAIAHQNQAVGLVSKDEADEYKRVLAYYQAVKELSEKKVAESGQTAAKSK